MSDRAVKSFVARARAGTATTGKLSDGGGLYLTLTPAGTAVWRVKYRIDGKERVFAAGIYPDVSLAAAREQRAEVKAHLRAGRDPVQSRSLRVMPPPFPAVARSPAWPWFRTMASLDRPTDRKFGVDVR